MTSVFLTSQDQIVAYRDGEHKLEQNFKRFHLENPHVYDTLVDLARQWQSRFPDSKCGIGMLFETARWDLGVRGLGEPVSLNNNYRAFYARLIMEEPGLADLFSTRRQRAAA